MSCFYRPLHVKIVSSHVKYFPLNIHEIIFVGNRRQWNKDKNYHFTLWDQMKAMKWNGGRKKTYHSDKKNRKNNNRFIPYPLKVFFLCIIIYVYIRSYMKVLFTKKDSFSCFYAKYRTTINIHSHSHREPTHDWRKLTTSTIILLTYTHDSDSNHELSICFPFYAVWVRF